jgi:hypothetical protein
MKYKIIYFGQLVSIVYAVGAALAKVFDYVTKSGKCISSECSPDGFCTTDCGPYYDMEFPITAVILAVIVFGLNWYIIHRTRKNILTK